jgi:hypothetical protein
MPTTGKRGLSCLRWVSVGEFEVIFCTFLPLKGVLKRAAEDSFDNLPALLVRVGEGLPRLRPPLAGFVFFFIRITISATQ